MKVNPEMPANLERGMGDCVQTEMLNKVDILKTGEIFPVNDEQVYKVGEIFLPQIISN